MHYVFVFLLALLVAVRPSVPEGKPKGYSPP